MLSLYAKVYGVSNSDAYREICDALAVNGFSPDYTVPEKTTPAEVEQSDAASVQEVHQTPLHAAVHADPHPGAPRTPAVCAGAVRR